MSACKYFRPLSAILRILIVWGLYPSFRGGCAGMCQQHLATGTMVWAGTCQCPPLHGIGSLFLTYSFPTQVAACLSCGEIYLHLKTKNPEEFCECVKSTPHAGGQLGIPFGRKWRCCSKCRFFCPQSRNIFL